MKYKIPIYLNLIYQSKQDSLSLILHFCRKASSEIRLYSVNILFNNLMKTSPKYSKVIENLFKETLNIQDNCFLKYISCWNLGFIMKIGNLVAQYYLKHQDLWKNDRWELRENWN